MTLDSIEAKIGSLAPDFKLLATHGQNVSLTDFRGKSNVIVFFIRETTCPQCRTHVAQLGRMYEQFKEAGTEVIAILGEGMEKAREYADEIGLPFPILCDPDRAVYNLYELEKYFLLFQRTASLVVDKDGIVRYLKRTTVPNVWLQESRELLGFILSLDEGQPVV
ncbi:MAG: peroxiredoxin family protein [Anaerolineales bacterium]|jgi:peroxiredoxin|uniref:peroxiredoxin family protein n=1 Tax=Candidatus Villigracilis vicinus TaxID=3140679 RepID=UPI00313745EC|nr:peroxiredoxin family protein [Anaerolineales bacterium]MBK7450934.1 peroxiredoxin family protein [Anaerolineales bacterium]MBK9779938.1 peroxiredoxin family protein [Anaerolineales bacterium]